MQEQEEEQKRFSFTYGLVMLRTSRANALMDRLGKLRIVKPLAWFLLVLMPIAAGLIFYLLAYELTILTSPRGAGVASAIRVLGPRVNFLLPGLNPYIPVVYGVIAIAVAVTIHEFSHGVVARSLGMPVKSAGVIFFLFIPIGAFVEVDEKVVRETKPRNALRMLAGGPGINMLVGVACLILLISSVSAMTPTVEGVPVISVAQSTPQQPSPALAAGIKSGDVITAIDGTPVTDLNYTLRTSGEFQPGQAVNVTLWRDGQSIVLPVTLGNTSQTIITVNANNVVISNKTYYFAYLGVGTFDYGGLQQEVANYVNAYKNDPFLYMVPPSFPIGDAPQTIPFSSLMIGFYNSPLGAANSIVDNLLFWLFFVNFNLAVFNCLPIYPMDGGQAFERFLVGAGRGRVSDALALRITTVVTVAVLLLLVVTIGGPYLGLF